MKTNGRIVNRFTAAGMLLLLALPLMIASSTGQDVRRLFEGDRAFEHVVNLTDLGPRIAGSENERIAAEYIAAELESYGLEVSIEEFPFLYFEDLGSSLAVVGGATLSSRTMRYSPSGAFTAEVVDCGLGYPEEFPADVAGKIALIRRGARPGSSASFAFKTQNAAAAGAVAAIIYNNRPGTFGGTLNAGAAIPAIAISAEEGQLLLDLLAAGPVVVDLSVETLAYMTTSQNVIGTLPGIQPEQGTVYIGAHYDSVAAGPGANDDASGVGAMLEAARVLTTGHRTKATVTFLAFGAEELGMVGSYQYVLGHSDEIAAQALGMINLDMIGVGDTLLIGNMGLAAPGLTELGQDIATGWDLVWEPFTAIANSDHAYFEQSGVPVMFIYQDPDPNYHTPADTPDHFNLVAYEDNGELATVTLYEWAKNPAHRARMSERSIEQIPVYEDQVLETR